MKSIKKNIQQMSLVILVLVLTGCPGGPTKPTIASFTASQNVLGGGGGSIDLSWKVSGADSLSIDQGVGVVTGNLKTVNVQKSTVFTLTATNGAGSSTATATVTVTALGTLDWKIQLGSSDFDGASGVATDNSGNVFMSGSTDGAIAGSNAGDYDAFLVKHDPSGNEVWRRQLDSNSYDLARGVATDSSGNVFMAGSTFGAITGSNAGSNDAFLLKYDPSGKEMWRRQLGSSNDDFAHEVATDSSGSVFVAGYTNGAITGKNAGREDAFLVKYDPSGNEVWRKQLGTSDYDYAYGVATDSNGNVFMAGYTFGAIIGSNPGSYDAFLVKYDPSGNEAWRRQLSSRTDDYAYGVATDSSGNVFMAGSTWAITGSNAGTLDAFVVRYK